VDWLTVGLQAGVVEIMGRLFAQGWFLCWSQFAVLQWQFVLHLQVR
jgi:hypothetical protein